MAFHRGLDGSEPVRPDPLGRLSGTQEERRSTRSSLLATGTLACPSCDLPVTPLDGGMRPRELLLCPFCTHGGPVRDFLSLEQPARPAHVAVRVVPRPRLR